MVTNSPANGGVLIQVKRARKMKKNKTDKPGLTSNVIGPMGKRHRAAGTTRYMSQLHISALQPHEDPSYRRTTFQI